MDSLHQNSRVLFESVEVAIVIVPNPARVAQIEGRCKVLVVLELHWVSGQVEHKVFKGHVPGDHTPVVLPELVLLWVRVLVDVTSGPVEVGCVPLEPEEGPATELAPINAHHPLQRVAVHHKLEVGGQGLLAFVRSHAQEGSPHHDVLQQQLVDRVLVFGHL